MYVLRQRFPEALAWGQANSLAGGVSRRRPSEAGVTGEIRFQYTNL
jgi:hypothetical protein